MSVYLFPYERKDGKLPSYDIWTEGVEDREHFINRDLKIYPPSEEVRKHLGVMAIETLLAYIGKLPSSNVNGIFGWRTRRAVRDFQREEGLPSPGYVGPLTAAHLSFALVGEVELELRIPDRLLFGLLSHESSFDFGIIGGATPDDRGLAQINRHHHGTGTPANISDEQAFDPLFSIPYAGTRMRGWFDEHKVKDRKISWDGAVLQHHNPVAARHLVTTGTYSEERFKSYVDKVRVAAGLAPHVP